MNIIKLQNISICRATTSDVDYMENQCAESPIGQATCDYQEYENQDIGFPDLQVTTADKDEVGHFQYQRLITKYID